MYLNCEWTHFSISISDYHQFEHQALVLLMSGLYDMMVMMVVLLSVLISRERRVSITGAEIELHPPALKMEEMLIEELQSL